MTPWPSLCNGEERQLGLTRRDLGESRLNRIIKVRCNGANRHVNDVDLDKAMREDTIARRTDNSLSPVPERLILRCRECADGRVILTREMIEDAHQRNSS